MGQPMLPNMGGAVAAEPDSEEDEEGAGAAARQVSSTKVTLQKYIQLLIFSVFLPDSMLF